IKDDTKLPVYCALIKLLLHDRDLCVRLAASRSLYFHIEYTSFSQQEFSDLLPVCWNRSFKLVEDVQEFDSKVFKCHAFLVSVIIRPPLTNDLALLSRLAPWSCGLYNIVTSSSGFLGVDSLLLKIECSLPGNSCTLVEVKTISFSSSSITMGVSILELLSSEYSTLVVIGAAVVVIVAMIVAAVVVESLVGLAKNVRYLFGVDALVFHWQSVYLGRDLLWHPRFEPFISSVVVNVAAVVVIGVAVVVIVAVIVVAVVVESLVGLAKVRYYRSW
ncbi:hypothetical protein Tco_0443078, partial [Tanacetum coccineum]